MCCDEHEEYTQECSKCAAARASAALGMSGDREAPKSAEPRHDVSSEGLFKGRQGQSWPD